MTKKSNTFMAIGILCLLMVAAAMPVFAQDQGDDFIPEGANSYKDKAENIGYGAASFLFVDGYTPWAAMIVNAGDPGGVDMVTVSFDEETETLSIELTDSNSTNHATVLVNKNFADKYIADANLTFDLSDAVNYDGMEESNETASDVYVFQVEHFSTQTIKVSDGGTAPNDTPAPGVLLTILVIASMALIVGIRKRR